MFWCTSQSSAAWQDDQSVTKSSPSIPRSTTVPWMRLRLRIPTSTTTSAIIRYFYYVLLLLLHYCYYYYTISTTMSTTSTTTASYYTAT